MAQLQQLGHGILMYQQDANGVYPIAMLRDPNGPQGARWLWNRSIEAPAGLMRDTSPEMRASHRAAWVNSVAPYWPNQEVLKIADAPIGGPRLKLEDTVQNPWLVGFNYNGLLHVYEQSAITHPELVPIIWTGQGRANREGYAQASPTLWCDALPLEEPCKFKSKPKGFATVRANMFLMYGPASVFDNAMVFAMADGSAQRMVPKMNLEPDPKTEDPWTSYSPDGRGMTFMVAEGYPPFFRPDRTPISHRDR
jgi:hypothetical protein